MREARGGKFSALAEREVLREVSARIALHPSRSISGFPQKIAQQDFVGRGGTTKHSLRRSLHRRRESEVCADEGDEGLFCDTIFPKKPLCPLPEKDARYRL